MARQELRSICRFDMFGLKFFIIVKRWLDLNVCLKLTGVEHILLTAERCFLFGTYLNLG